MSGKNYELKADISSSNPEGIEAKLFDLVGATAVARTDKGFRVTATMIGESARELNRSFLSALRRVSKMTTLRAEWTHDGTTERFFDYAAKGIRQG
ncbi:MAG: hypothetical protein M1378_01430 [Bacteroidetes bacterium]|nr:hypothetical protein [Bacteroidota bacterium]